MSDFLGRLAERALGFPPAIVPVTPSRYDRVADTEAWSEVEELVEPAPAKRPLDPPADAQPEAGRADVPASPAGRRPPVRSESEPQARQEAPGKDVDQSTPSPSHDAAERHASQVTFAAGETAVAPPELDAPRDGPAAAPRPRNRSVREAENRAPIESRPEPPRRSARREPQRVGPAQRAPQPHPLPPPARPATRVPRRREKHESPAQTVQVSIDRIHVHADTPPGRAAGDQVAPMPAASERPAPRWSPRRLSLDEYLRRGPGES